MLKINTKKHPNYQKLGCLILYEKIIKITILLLFPFYSYCNLFISGHINDNNNDRLTIFKPINTFFNLNNQASSLIVPVDKKIIFR